MSLECRQEDNEIRERLTRVEEGIKSSGDTSLRIEKMLTLHIANDEPIKEKVILNTAYIKADIDRRKSTRNMIASIWVAIISIIGTWINGKVN